jgi:WD40 repeat protein
VVACTAEGPVCVWDLTTGQKVQTLDVNGQKMIDIRYSPDGAVLAMLDSEERCEVYDAKTGARLAMAERLGDGREELRFSPDGEQLAIGTRDGIYFWDYDTGHPRQVRIPRSLRPTPRLGLQFGGGMTRISPDLRTAATQTEQGDVGIWDIASCKVLGILPARHRKDVGGGGVDSIMFSANGDLLATTNRTGHVEIWRLRGTRQPVPGVQPIDADGVPGPWGPIVNGIRTRLIMEPVKPDAQLAKKRHVDATRMPVSEDVWWEVKLQVQNTTDHKLWIVRAELRGEGGLRVTTVGGTPVPYQFVAGESKVARNLPSTITAPGDIQGMGSLLLGRNHDLSRPGKYRIQFPRTETPPPLPIDTTNPILPESNVLEFENSGPLKEEAQQ